MTFNIGKIEGGTRAGWRTVKQAVGEWECQSCESLNKGFFVKCPLCGGQRDGDQESA